VPDRPAEGLTWIQVAVQRKRPINP
jgi:hypothetical protein